MNSWWLLQKFSISSDRFWMQVTKARFSSYASMALPIFSPQTVTCRTFWTPICRLVNFETLAWKGFAVKSFVKVTNQNYDLVYFKQIARLFTNDNRKLFKIDTVFSKNLERTTVIHEPKCMVTKCLFIKSLFLTTEKYREV